MDIEQRAAWLGSKGRYELRQGGEVVHDAAGQPKTASNAAQITPPEHRAGVAQPIRPKLVDLRPISPVIKDAQQDRQVVPPHRLKLLRMHEQSAISVEEHNRLVRMRSRDPDRVGQPVTYSPELANGMGTVRAAATHVCGEVGAVSRAVDDLPLLRERLIQRAHRIPRIE